MTGRISFWRSGAAIAVGMLLPATSFAQVVVPPSADVSRVNPSEQPSPPDRSADEKVTVPQPQSAGPVPEGASNIHFVLKGVVIKGATAFTELQLSEDYSQYIGKEITLDKVWLIAGAITERYNNAGYFLSRAYIPEQSIKSGTIEIRVVEGYVGKVELPENLRSRRVVEGYVKRLVAQKPASTAAVESFLLRMNDLPGLSFRSVLSPMDEKGAPEEAVKLVLEPSAKQGQGSIGFDNYSSRYLGPNELNASYSTSLLPMQQTGLSLLTSLPMDRLRYGTLNHSIVLAPDLTLELSGGATKAYPGFTLEKFNIDSVSVNGSIGLNYQWIRQRDENLSFKLSFDRKDIRSDIIGTPLTRDHIRALRLQSSYDVSDDWRGYNTASMTLSHGLRIIEASGKNDANLTRAGASPTFTKAELALSRTQGISDNWVLFANASGQWASGVLYSSEQFGYGGQSFGRAYDASDITGDHGINGALELRYGGWGGLDPIRLQPYTFYDIGTVWNEAVGQSKRESGASTGIGVRFATTTNQSGNFSLAWPLTRTISTPIYGGGTKGPRISVQVGQSF